MAECKTSGGLSGKASLIPQDHSAEEEICLYLYCKSYFHVAPAVALKTSVDAVLHHGNELLVAQEAVPVVVKYLENWKSCSLYYMSNILKIAKRALSPFPEE